MKENWMIDVLADLRKYALNNGMSTLADQLDTTIHVALDEMMPQCRGNVFVGHGSSKDGGVLRPFEKV